MNKTAGDVQPDNWKSDRREYQQRLTLLQGQLFEKHREGSNSARKSNEMNKHNSRYKIVIEHIS